MSSNATLTVRTPPVIVTHPTDKTVNPGANVTFSVVVTGTGPFTYQWQKNGVNTPGTLSSYTINNAQVSHSGTYTVIVSNSVGSETSDPATLTVNQPPAIAVQPQNQTVSSGNTAVFSVTATGSEPLTYQWHINGSNIPGATGSSHSISNVTSANAGSYSVTVANMAGLAASDTASLTVHPRPEQFNSPEMQFGQSLRLTFQGEAGMTNIIEVSSNLVNWLVLTNIVNTAGTVEFNDATTNSALRFYRTRRVP